MTGLLVALSLIGSFGALVFRFARSQIAPLPEHLATTRRAPAAVLIQPVVRSDPGTLRRLRRWLRCAELYPGPAHVIWSTVEAAAPALRTLASQHPDLDVQVVSTPDDVRRREPGLDKAHRMTRAQDRLSKIAGNGPCVVLAIDDDVQPLDDAAMERLVAAAPAPGWTATVTIPPLDLPARAPAWMHLQELQARSLDQVLAVGERFFGQVQGLLQGYCSVLWREDLERLGGWTAVTGFLGEDIGLGVRAARAGLRTQLFDPAGALGTDAGGGDLGHYAAQQKRWSAMRRACPTTLRWTMTLGLPLKVPVVAGTLAWCLAPGLATTAVAGLAWALAGANLVRRPAEIPLLPLEELVTVLSHLVGEFAVRLTYGPWLYRIDRRGRIVEKTWRGPSH